MREELRIVSSKQDEIEYIKRFKNFANDEGFTHSGLFKQICKIGLEEMMKKFDYKEKLSV